MKLSEFTAGIQILTMQSHSNLNPFKLQWLQLWSSSPVITSSALLCTTVLHFPVSEYQTTTRKQYLLTFGSALQTSSHLNRHQKIFKPSHQKTLLCTAAHCLTLSLRWLVCPTSHLPSPLTYLPGGPTPGSCQAQMWDSLASSSPGLPSFPF